MKIISTLKIDERTRKTSSTDDIFKRLIQKDQYVGEVYSISYETANVQIHDHFRQQVGGIPSLCFLIATRIASEQKGIECQKEDSSIILLRVMDSSPLPTDAESARIRAEVAQKVAGDHDVHWDDKATMDAMTHNLLSFAGVKCKVIGTFFVEQDTETKSVFLRFGSDISNYYPNRGLKVYKPNADALSTIVNYVASDSEAGRRVWVGEVRYASTNRQFQGVSDVKFYLSPYDLLSQKTALFGMTRTGKSNTTKIILQSVFNLRFPEATQTTELDALEAIPLRKFGQIVFDPDGEYANENEQDAGENKNPTAIKNVWKAHPQGKQEDVVTYGILTHPNDTRRTLMLLNFYKEENLQIGKQIIDAMLEGDTAKFILNFKQVTFEQPATNDHSAKTRFDRRVLVYRALLARAGFSPPKGLQPSTRGLFSDELLRRMRETGEPDFISAATVLARNNLSWDELSLALERLNNFLATPEYKRFDEWYMTARPHASGNNWADDSLKNLLTMFHYPNGTRQMGRARTQHSADTTQDYAEAIYQDLCAGRLVIVDQSSGDPEINVASAKRIMWKIFEENRQLFRQGKPQEEIPEILIYVEEAHNLLPTGDAFDPRDVWVRTAKEGAKYHIGLIYATQEVSSIQRNILKNTANWFIGHLNNTDETKELCKYYDFEDFEPSIRRAPDKGFLRVKTLSNRFTVPVQIRPFEV
jgi:hypothetical protein